MVLMMLSGCVADIFFPPDLWAWDSGWDTGGRRRPNRGGDDDDDDDDTTPGTSPVQIGLIESGCDLDATAWVHRVTTTGWVGFGKLDVIRFGDQSREAHDLYIVASDPEGAWDQLQAGPLPDGVDPTTQQANVDSRFDCDLDADTLSYVARVRAGDGTLIDCAVWGADPEAAMALIRTEDPDVLALGGCQTAVVSP